MTFDDILEQVIALLKRQGRVSYGAMKRRFELDDAYLEDLKGEILYVHPVVDDEGRGLIWTGDTEDIQGTTTSQSDQAEPQPVVEQAQPAHVHTPSNASSVQDTAERRQLTILFTDLVDSTKLSGQFDAEDYREIVRAYQATCGEVVERFDCHLAQHLGDGLLIYSGYPVAHDNDAERAVRTGLGILDAMKALNERLEQEKDIRLGVRVGIHTGPVVVGDVGAGSRHEQLALGEVPNITARIQGLAEPDTVVISEATYRLVQGYFDCESLGEHALRGVADPIAVYQVLRESGVQSRLDVASTRGLTPLVGRESEMTLLLERWEQVKDGQGQVVLLSGEAGIGKSKIAHTLKDHVADEPHVRWECRSSPYYQHTALYPITDLFQRTLRFQADDTPEEKLGKLEQELRQYRLPLEESIQLFAPLVSVSIPEDRYPPLNWTPQRQRQKTLESIVAMLLELAEQQPVLFILENLHWTDPTTLELLDLLIDQTPTASLLTLLTCRPAFQPSWSHRSYLSEMTLNRLTQSQIARIAEHTAGGKRLPAAVLAQITEKTDGVPLFVEEITKAVLESGVLKQTNEHYELTAPLTSLTIPATLQDSLMARLDRLVTAKAVAQYAAVIGRQFSYELLHTVSQFDEATLQRELSRLVEAELVYQRGVPPQATYTFKHALIQDTAYESLLRRTRQHSHHQIANALVTQFPDTADTQPELLAYHYMEAGFNEQAIYFWQKAGGNAIQRSAHKEGIAHLTKGLVLLQTRPETRERVQQELNLQISLGAALTETTGWGSSNVERVYLRARELCQQVEEATQVFSVLNRLCNLYTVRGNLQTARELGEQLLSLTSQQGDSLYLMNSHASLGQVLSRLGEDIPAREHLEQARIFGQSQQHRSQTFDQTMGILRSLLHIPPVLWRLGYPDQALARSREPFTFAQQLSRPFELAYVHHYGALIHQARGEWQATQEQAEAVIALATEHGFAQWKPLGMIVSGWAMTAQGQVEEGIAQMQQSLTALQATGSEISRSFFLTWLADAYSKAGHVEEGLRVLTESQTLAQTTGERLVEAERHRFKGTLLLRQTIPDEQEAETCFQQAIAIAQHQSAKSWELRATTSLARLWQSQGKRKNAYDLLAPVYGWFQEGFDTADLIDAKALLGELQA